MKITTSLSAITLATSLLLSMNSVAATADITGKYYGMFTTTMNSQADEGPKQPDMDGVWQYSTWPANFLTGDNNGVQYAILGNSVVPGYWLWDFDKKLVTAGGSTLLALGMIPAPFQLYNRTVIEQKTAETYPAIMDLDEVTIPFTITEQGNVTFDYAHKIHIVPPFPVPGVAEYPIGEAQATLSVTTTENGGIALHSADVELQPMLTDDVPGTRVEGVFPAIVQSEFISEELLPYNDLDTDNDGITDMVERMHGFNVAALDSDGDGTNDADEIGTFIRPLDSDGDGLPDVLEVSEFANNNSVLSGFNLLAGGSVTIGNESVSEAGEKITMQLAHSSEVNLTTSAHEEISGDLPAQSNADGAVLDYSRGMLNFKATIPFDLVMEPMDIPFSLVFSEAIPADLVIYQRHSEMDFMTGKYTVTFPEVTWEVNAEDGNRIDLQLPVQMGGILDVGLIIASTEVPVIPEEVPTETTEETTEEEKAEPAKPEGQKSSGSLFSILGLLVGLLVVRRRSMVK